MIDDDGLVFNWRGAGSIDDAHVGKRDHRRIHGEKRLRAGCEAVGLSERGGSHSEQEDDGFRQDIVGLL